MASRFPKTHLIATLAGLLSACMAAPVDYAPFRQHLPRSILVLPPLNNSTAVDAPYVYLSTVSRPLGECGYYVYPVAVIDALMKENGLPTPDEMHTVPLEKIREIIGADAVLYVVIEDWGQKYQIVQSTTVVKARATLVDVATGTTLWTGTAEAAEGSGGGGDPIAMVVAALIDQVVDSMLDAPHALCATANAAMVSNQQTGLLLGPRHPDHDADPRGR